MGRSYKRLLGAVLMVTASSSFAADADSMSENNCMPPALACASFAAEEIPNYFTSELTDIFPNKRAASDATILDSSSWSLSITPFTAHDTQSATTNLTGQITNALTTELRKHADQLSDRINITRTISGTDAFMRAMSQQRSASQATTQSYGFYSTGQNANVVDNLLRNVGDIRISATMPAADSASRQHSEQQLQDAINSDVVSEYLSQRTNIAQLLAKMLGWESTGLQPTATDIQKMASAHLNAIANAAESWALNNVSVTSRTLALTDSNTFNRDVQWQWSINNSQFSSSSNNADTYGGSSLGSSLRAMFGMAEY